VEIKCQLDATEVLLHLVGILFPHINDDARSKSHQTSYISIVSAFVLVCVGRCLMNGRFHGYGSVGNV